MINKLKMDISKFSNHIFWSYKKGADLPDALIINQVSLYGEIEDMLLMKKMFQKKEILKVLKTLHSRYPKRVHFIEKVILQ